MIAWSHLLSMSSFASQGLADIIKHFQAMKERKSIFDCNIFKVFCYFSFFMDILVLRLDVWNNLCLSFTMILWATFYFLGWFFSKEIGIPNFVILAPPLSRRLAVVWEKDSLLAEIGLRIFFSWRTNWLEDWIGGTGGLENGEGEGEANASQRAGWGGLRPIGLRRPEAPAPRGAVRQQRVAQLHGLSLVPSLWNILVLLVLVLQFLHVDCRNIAISVSDILIFTSPL